MFVSELLIFTYIFLLKVLEYLRYLRSSYGGSYST